MLLLMNKGTADVVSGKTGFDLAIIYEAKTSNSAENELFKGRSKLKHYFNSINLM